MMFMAVDWGWVGESPAEHSYLPFIKIKNCLIEINFKNIIIYPIMAGSFGE